MEPSEALADLTEISPQIGAAVVFEEGGAVLASTLADTGRATQLARLGERLIAAAAGVRAEAEGPPTQVHADLCEGDVFLVRDAGRTIAATTGGEPTVGLVFYDLRSCLRALDVTEPEPDAA